MPESKSGALPLGYTPISILLPFYYITSDKKNQGCFGIFRKNEKNPETYISGFRCRHRSIFPGRLQPSIFDANELNFRVRNGNGWNLIAINTGSFKASYPEN